MTAKRARVPYAVAGTAGRSAIEVVLDARPKVSESTLRVLLVLVAHLPLWSRLEDDILRSSIAELAGVDVRTVTRAVQVLETLGVIEWRSGHNGRASHVRIVRSSATTTCPTTSDDDALEVPSGSRVVGQVAGHSGPSSGTPSCPTPENTENPEKRDDQLSPESDLFRRGSVVVQITEAPQSYAVDAIASARASLAASGTTR